MASPFDVLRVDPAADEATVRRAYRERVFEAHPDHGGSAAEFRRVQNAYERLSSGDYPDDELAVADASADDPAATEPEKVTVEYLNYEVLADHGWALDDEDLFEAAAGADLADADYGEFQVHPHESLLEAAENRGHAWPYACRGGACANCAVALWEGELEMPKDTVLPPEMKARGIRLSCNGIPVSDELKILYNIKHLPALEELRLPPRPFEQAYASD